jgi:hypothetical protein
MSIKAGLMDRAKLLLLTSTMSVSEIANVLSSDVTLVYRARQELDQHKHTDSVMDKLSRLGERLRELELRVASLERSPVNPVARRLAQHRAKAASSGLDKNTPAG